MIAIDPESLPTFTVERPQQVQLVPTGGTAPYTFKISSGALPLGLKLIKTGIIVGIPKKAGYYSGLVLAVTDSATPPFTSTVTYDVQVENA